MEIDLNSDHLQKVRQSFLEILEKNKIEADKLSKNDWVQIQEIWKQQISNLLFQIKTWLNPYNEKGLLKIFEYKTTINEPYLGAYETKCLIITIPNQLTFQIIPSAYRYISTLGRVDFKPCKGDIWNNFQFLLTAPEQWVIYDYDSVSQNPTQDHPEDLLTEETFINCFQRLIQKMDIK